jgi:hypothetical protein
MACKIDRGSAFNCASLTQPGIGDYIILINKEDLDNGAITVDGTSKEIETITLDTGTYGYKIESSKGSAQILLSSPLRAVTAIDGFDHTVDSRWLDASQLSVENAEKLRWQKVVALVPLAAGGALMYGRNVGMRMSDFQYNPGDADTGGTLQVIVKTPENDPPEIHAPIRIASTFDITTLLAS